MQKLRIAGDRGARFSAILLSSSLKSLMFCSGTSPADPTVMNQWREEMKVRAHKFAVDVIRFVDTLPYRANTSRLKDQLVGAACGVDGNWHAACRARTHKEFAARLGTVVEEADEAEEWLDVMHDTKMSESNELNRLRAESKELRAIFAKASRTANENEGRDRTRREGRRRKERKERPESGEA